MKIEEQSLAEQKYVNLDGLSFEEAEKWSQLLSICKDISDSNIPVGDVKKGALVGLAFHKTTKGFSFNGAVSFEDADKHLSESRWIDGVIEVKKENILVTTNVTRLSVQGPSKEYAVVDQFTVKDGVIIGRTSYYNNEKSNKFSDEINMNIGGNKK